LSKHIDFHLSFKLNGDVHSLINLLNGLKRRKGGKHALECLKVDESLNMEKEANPKVDQTSKEFLAFLDAFRSFMVQQGETTTQNHEMTKLMG